MENRAWTALVNLAAMYGAKRPVWRGDEQVAICWINRAEWLCKVARDGLPIEDAIAECDRYSGRSYH